VARPVCLVIAEGNPLMQRRLLSGAGIDTIKYLLATAGKEEAGSSIPQVADHLVLMGCGLELPRSIETFQWWREDVCHLRLA
jgi:hypothetical protein